MEGKTMRITITDIYRIETMNSVYEIKVIDHPEEGIFSMCKKMGQGERQRIVKVEPLSNLDYLEKLVIGASFDVPGVVLTSVVHDYQHFKPAHTLKRRLNDARTHVMFNERHDGTPANEPNIVAFTSGEEAGSWLANKVIAQVHQQAVRVDR